MRNFGYAKSDMKGVANASEFKIETHLPASYDIASECHKVIDQGNRGICVSVSMNEVLSTFLKRKNKGFDKPIDYYYNLRQDKKVDGMSVREAMDIAKKDGDIKMYANIQDIDTMKYSIFANGACAICLPVNNMEEHFWKGKPLLGGHCVVLTGWTKDSFILRNSWGMSYGNGGYTYFPFEDWKYLLEAWTVLR